MTLAAAWLIMVFCGISIVALVITAAISWWQVRTKGSSNPTHVAIHAATLSFFVPGSVLILLGGFGWGLDRAIESRSMEPSGAGLPKRSHAAISDKSSMDSAPLAKDTALAVEMRVNGNRGSITLRPSETFTYGWTSRNASYCEMVSPVKQAISPSGTSRVIGPGGGPFYPEIGRSVTYAVICSVDGLQTVTDAVTILAQAADSDVVGKRYGLAANISANGIHGSITLRPGETFSYSWSSRGASVCELVSPAKSGIPASGTSTVIGPGDPFYPSPGHAITIAITCPGSEVWTVTDAVTIKAAK
ncbi:MAG TPA: hypothetical protein VGQ30_03505 [Gemmatimonadaceae bacterium]|nr:hypothetical protein [Gemmatimonadaceae bacterium]